ncbi:DUF1285 domain-containing protein [Marinobacter oulmenensis]|uniref:DUF1285 domain-containing protein n=1 Tax=Marinobacter oulmenensis TaxID=643747 RepID=A0A840U8M6_9GAMM|nr:DUF1285 domain-containing protein [Marinobacter oulmenensis]MBB5320583.1 hypothetical protein [Marinobacter oulmenensis]
MNPDAIFDSVKEASPETNLPPIEDWHPELSGDMDLVISRNGQWLFEGRAIPRQATIRLFSTILRREDDGEYYLVTPVEKWRIQVEDTPLLAHSVEVRGLADDQVITVTTNMGETLEIGERYPLTVENYPDSEEPRPVVGVRRGLEARLVTNAFYDLADLVDEHVVDGETQLGVMSNGKFWKIGENG